MRIIGGKYKGRKLFSMPKRKDTSLLRPTTDRVKESLFAILNEYIEGTNFLDIFAGTGNIGIEALSRGAEKVVFVEADRKFCDIIKRNLKHIGVPSDKYSIICSDFIKALKKLGNKNEKFDFIYADPPYEKGYYTKIVNLIKNFDILDENGLLILEEPKKQPFLPDNKEWIVEKRDYGTTKLTFINFSDSENLEG